LLWLDGLTSALVQISSANSKDRSADRGKNKMDDTVQLHCHRCKSVFRDKARRVQSGYSRQCPSCETIMFFEEASIDKNVQRTLRDAKHVRKALREHEEEKIARGPFVFGRNGSSRSSAGSHSDEQDDYS
jgi:predicted  nucleic acid-binding Zn-ribbon protein